MGDGAQSQAYCVSTDHFVRIGQPSSNLGSSGVITAGFDPALYNKNGSQVAVEAVVTSINKIVSLSAVSMVMQAQGFDKVWRTVADGHNYCLRCSSVSLVPFPVTAQRVKVDVVLSEAFPTGLLWLASYSYQTL